MGPWAPQELLKVVEAAMPVQGGLGVLALVMEAVGGLVLGWEVQVPVERFFEMVAVRQTFSARVNRPPSR